MSNKKTGKASSDTKLIFKLAELRQRLGSQRVEKIVLEVPEQNVISSRSTAAPVTGEVLFESIERGVSVYGQLRFGWEAECRRCLELVSGELDATVDEIFQVKAPDDSEFIDFDGDSVDLAPIIADSVSLALPLVPLCSDDCAGPDPSRYPALTIDEAQELKASRSAELAAEGDPRWAALSELNLDN